MIALEVPCKFRAMSTMRVWTGILLVALLSPAWAGPPEDVTWANGDVTLSGSLYLPQGDGPHPAFVFLHGSGPETRSAFTMQQYASQFARHGIAMLLYDKRGAGKSTGDWLQSDYPDLAGDAMAGLEMLSARSDIDAAHLGVIGASEGGWTGPLVVNASPHVGLAILISASPQSPMEQGIYEFKISLRREGVGDADIAEAESFERLRLRVWAGDEGWGELDTALATAQTRPWYEAAGRPTAPDKSSPRFAWYRRVMQYDPLPALRALRVPALFLYGQDDSLVDAARSSAEVETLGESANKDFSVHVYGGRGHGLTDERGRYADDHWDRIFGWIANYW